MKDGRAILQTLLLRGQGWKLKGIEMVKDTIVGSKTTGDVAFFTYLNYFEVACSRIDMIFSFSEFCGLTLKDIDLEDKIVLVDHQFQWTAQIEYLREETKTKVGKRRLPITDEAADVFRAIIEDRESQKVEKVIDGHSGFLFFEEINMPLVAMYWQH